MHRQGHQPRQPFLEKFEGRKQNISKEGLLHLLEQQRDSHHHRHQVNSQRAPKQLSPLLPSPTSKAAPPLTQPDNERGPSYQIAAIGSRGSRVAELVGRSLQGRYSPNAPSNNFQSQQLVSRLKLPAINKSSSLSHQLRKQNTEQLNGEQSSTGLSLAKPGRIVGRRDGHDSLILNSLTKRMELDSYALRHLQFMDKFEKQLIHNDIISKRTARTELLKRQF